MKKGIRRVLVLLLALSMVFTTMGLPAYADDTGLADGTYNAKGLSTAVLSMYHFHDAQVIVKGDNAWLITTEDTGSTVDRFDGMAYGPQSQILDPADETNHTLVEGTATATVVPVYNDDDELVTRTFVLPVPKSVFENGENIYYMIKYRDGFVNSSGDSHDGDWYKARGGDYYLTGYTLEKVSDSTALPGEETPVEEDADYSAVDAAIAAIPADLSIYTDESVQALNEAVDAVVRDKKVSEQDAVDAMAQAINDAVAALQLKETEPEKTELEITNNTGMFKAVTATAVANADGSAALTFALSGTGYHWLYKGTYEEALAANDAIAAGIAADEGSANLIKGYTNDEGKWEFQMTIDADELGKEVPVVAISDSYYQKFVNGQNALERAYYPRQFNLDMDAKTLVTGDYDMEYEFALTTDLDDFKAASPVSVHIVGGPNSNNYKVESTLVMNDETYDKVTFPSTSDSKEAVLTDGAFAISMVNQPNNAAFKDKTPLTFTFHVAEGAPYEEAGTDVVRTVTFDQVAKTITVEGTALTPKESGPTIAAGQYVISAKVTKSSPEGTAFTMFIPNLSGATASNDPDDNKVNLIVDEEGGLKLQFTNYKTSYPAIYMGTLTEGQNPESFDASKLKVGVKEGSIYSYTFTIDASLLGTSFPIALAKKAEPGSANSDWYTTQLYMTLGDELMDIAVYNVIKQIDALPAVNDITVLDKDAIEAARAAYDDLTDEQKAEVTNLNKLTAAEEAFAALPEKDEVTTAVETAMNTLIQQYVDVNETTAAAVAKVRADYDALTTQQKAYIDDAALFKLHRAEACVAFVNDGIAEGTVYDMALDTSDNSPFIAATISPRSNAAYVYLYSVTGEYDNAKLVSGKVSKSTHTVVGQGSVLKGLWQVKTTDGQGRTFVIQLTGANGNSSEYTVKVPGVYGVMKEGSYEVAAVQTPSSSMRKFARSTVTSDGTAMTVEFVMPNTTYGKVFLGTKEEAAAATEGFIEPKGTEATGENKVGNVYSIPLESMYMPITISYCNTGKNTWTQETIEFVVDEQSQAVIDAIAVLDLDTYFHVTAEQREQVAAANELYQALNDNQKAVVDNANGGVIKRTAAMFAAADKVAPQIEALPAADGMTADDVAQVREVKNAFDTMGQDPDLLEATNGNSVQNSQIEKLISQELRAKLSAAVAKADEFDQEAAAPVMAMIEALPEAENVAEGDYEAIKAAHNAYEGLTDTQKAFVTNHDKLAACEEKVPADYSAVDAAVATVPADLTIYTEETAGAVTAAVEAVDRTKMFNEQAAVDAMAQAINDAVAALEKKPADYSAVEAAKAAVPEDLSIYTEETVKAVNDAIEAVVEGKKIDEQADVDAMAQAIEDAVAALKIDIAKADVDADDEMTVTGEALEPSVVVVLNGEELEEDVDFTIAYKDNVEVGEATIVITGIGDYAGTVEKTFIIRPDTTGADDQREETFVRLLSVKIDDKDASLYTPDSFAVYEEAKATLESLLDDEWATAEEIKEARLAYLKATYELVEKDEQTISGPAAITKTYGSAAFGLDAETDGDGEITYETDNAKVATVDASGKVTIKGAGKATITISAAATDTYKAAVKKVTLTVNKKAQSVTGPKAKITKKYGNKAFSLNAKASGNGKLTYQSSNTKVATVSSAGKVTIKGAGTAKITIKAAATSNYKAASKTVTVKVSKAANTMKASGKTAAVKASKVKKSSQTVVKAKAFKVSKAVGKVSFKKASGNAKIKVTETGKITVKKGLKKGTYKVKVKVKAAGNKNYKPKTKTVTVTIKVN